jgi:hypothetical protein
VLALSRVAEYLDGHYPAYRLLTRGVTIAYVCFLPLTVISLGLLNAVTLLVCYIQVYTLLHKKEARNYYHLHLMALFLLLAACVQNPEPVIGLVMLFFMVGAVWAGLAIRLLAEEQRVAALPVPEIVGLDNLDHHAFQKRAALSRGKMPLTATGLSVCMVLLTVLFFMLTPRIEAGIFGRNQQEVQRVGLAETVELESGSTIQQNATPVMMVSFPDLPGGRVADEDWLYWRVATLGRYEDNSWKPQMGEFFDPGISHSGPVVREVRQPPEGMRNALLRRRRPDKDLVHQVIFLDDVPSKGLPAMHLVYGLRVLDDIRRYRLRWGRVGDLSVMMEGGANLRRLNYEVWSEPGRPSDEALRAAPPFELDPNDERSANFLEHDLLDETVALTNDVVGDAETPYDKALAIQNYLSGSEFLYSLSIPYLGEENVIDTFINTAKIGHCELFATAMALMLRTQGIPTRVVNGYRGGEWLEGDQTYTIRANMAHLWVEAWFPEVGWVIFDPSPRGDSSPGSMLEELAYIASRTGMKAKMFWYQEVVAFDGATQMRRLQESSLGFVRNVFGGDEEDPADATMVTAADSGNSTVLLRLMLVGVVIASTWLFLRQRRNGHQGVSLSPEQLRVIGLYMALRRRLGKHGVDCRGMTAEEVRDVLLGPRWGAPDDMLELLECYNTVRFGGHPADPARLGELQRAIRQLQPRELEADGVPATT